MNVNNLSVITMTICAGAALALVGCKSQPEPVNAQGQYDGTAPHARPGTTYDPRYADKAPAPKTASATTPAQTPAAQPAAKPAAVAGNVMYVPTGERTGSPLMIEKIYPSVVSVGVPFDYVIRATNIGAGTLNQVVITEAAPTNFTISSVTPQGSNNNYNLGNLNPGESKTVTMRGMAPTMGQITGCASATFSTALCHAINVVQPALSISKRMTEEHVLNCTPINLTIEVKNTGSGTASNVHVMDQLPQGMSLASGQTSFDEAIGDLAPGATKTITKELKVASVGRYENVASTKADGIAPVTSNKVALNVRLPKFELTCKAGGIVMMGREACYELTVKNAGDAAATNAKVIATIPAGATVTNAGEGTVSGSTFTANIPSLAAGASKTFKFCLKTMTIAPLNISATATGDCTAPASTNCSVEVYGAADIGTSVTDDSGIVPLGAPHEYQVQVMNQGQIPLTGTKMVVTIPAGMEFVSSPLGKLEGGKVVFHFGNVAPGATVNSTFVAKCSKIGEMLIIGETTANEIKTPVRDDELTTYVEKP